MAIFQLPFSVIVTAALCLIATFSMGGVSGFQAAPPVMTQRNKASLLPQGMALEAVSSRKAFLASAAATVVVMSTAVPAHADEYDDARAAKRAKAAESNGGTALAVPLIGGLALSLPFFLPNILRLFGVKNSKMK